MDISVCVSSFFSFSDFFSSFGEDIIRNGVGKWLSAVFFDHILVPTEYSLALLACPRVEVGDEIRVSITGSEESPVKFRRGATERLEEDVAGDPIGELDVFGA